MTFQKFSSVTIAISALVCANLPAAPAQSRTWTNEGGRTLVGTLVQVFPDSAKVKLANGSIVTLANISLSKADQAYLDEQRKAPAAATTTPAATTKSATPTSGTTWPQKVSLKEIPEITVVKEDDATKEYIYQSPHYEFRSPARLGASVVREFARIFEATYQANWALPLDFKPTPEEGQEKFLCTIYETYEDYIKAGGVAGSAGIYSSGDKTIKVPLKSLGVKFFGKKLVLERGDDNGTLIHEITHQMMTHWLGKLPIWYIEGSAEYIRMAEYERGNMSFNNMDKNFQNFLRGRGSDGKSYTMVPLKTLMTLDGNTWARALSGSGASASRNYGSAGALAFYFYHCDDKGDGQNIINFIRAIEKGEHHIKAMTTHLLRDRTYEQLQEEVEKALRKKGVKITWG